ncbi:leucine--tRNA ligase [Candidatus Uhrbacteria bacterium]|nr:leucine--tRNA ligase [Candidatus Uhrbacteria bacterium]
MPYNHREIEPKWQKRWEKNHAGEVTEEKRKREDARYHLVMFPYPSGAGLHVGHVESYTGVDIMTRKARMEGKHVLFPIGFDAFGLPAENYAIKSGTHPAETTKAAIENFTRQMKSVGLSFDWSRTLSTADPAYYKWTQWIFLKLYEAGLAYKAKAPVNWCESCHTVLANEQVVDGRCDRCHNPVVQKELEQWFFRITKYAEELLAGLEHLDWPERLKAMQRNWIGRSEGVEIDFLLVAGNRQPAAVRVFTTRPDTIFGATYLVLAPEHPLVGELTTSAREEEVEAYKKSAAKKTALERAELSREKTGVFTGSYAINPATGENIPIWIADYVLASYGVGAIMAVPAHDERDRAFAEIYNLPIKNIVPEENNFGTKKTTYRLRDWLVSRQRFWGAPIPIVYDPEGQPHPVKEKHLPLLLPTDVDFRPTGESPIARSEEYAKRAEKLYGKGWRFEVDTMDTFVDSSWYFLRYVDPTNEKKFADAKSLDYWCPVDLYVGGVEHAVLHLLYARFFCYALKDLGIISFDEPFLKLRNQGMILGPDGAKMSKSRGNVINPDEVVAAFGADTLRMYEMFMGPFEEAKPWDTNGVLGVRRFLDRVWRVSEEVGDVGKAGKVEKVGEVEREIHKTIKKVSEDTDAMRFNTAIAQMMICANAMQDGVRRESFEMFVKILAPYAPHLAEEIWEKLGHSVSIFDGVWPSYDPALAQDVTVEFAVQVNGKLRATISLSKDTSQADVETQARRQVGGHLADRKVARVVFVPGRLINFVVLSTKED